MVRLHPVLHSAYSRSVYTLYSPDNTYMYIVAPMPPTETHPRASNPSLMDPPLSLMKWTGS